MEPVDSSSAAVLTMSVAEEGTWMPRKFLLNFPDPPPSAGSLMEVLTGLQFADPGIGGIRQPSPGCLSFEAEEAADPDKIAGKLRQLLESNFGIGLIVGD
jgi:hypothetical protein